MYFEEPFVKYLNNEAGFKTLIIWGKLAGIFNNIIIIRMRKAISKKAVNNT